MRTDGEPEATGIVFGVHPGGAVVAWGDEEKVATLRRRLLSGGRQRRRVLAPGDHVVLDQPAGEQPAIREVLPRRNTLSRTGGSEGSRVLAANVALLVVVGSVREPPLRAGILDRFLVTAALAGVPTLLLVNKWDLDASEEESAAIDAYRNLGYSVVVTSAVTGHGLDDLIDALPSGLTVLAGHSGVGKSSVLNLVIPDFDAVTAELSRKWRRGRHTTSQARIARLDRHRYVADTPGVRTWSLSGLTAAQVLCGFPELQAAGAACHFGGCTHTHEPDCEVKRAVSEGRLPAFRYRSYLRILEDEKG